MRFKNIFSGGVLSALFLSSFTFVSAQTTTPTSTPLVTAAPTAAALPEAGYGLPTYLLMFMGVSLVILAGIYFTRTENY